MIGETVFHVCPNCGSHTGDFIEGKWYCSLCKNTMAVIFERRELKNFNPYRYQGDDSK